MQPTSIVVCGLRCGLRSTFLIMLRLLDMPPIEEGADHGGYSHGRGPKCEAAEAGAEDDQAEDPKDEDGCAERHGSPYRAALLPPRSVSPFSPEAT